MKTKTKMRKALSAIVLSSVFAGLLPAVTASASGTEPYRTVRWESETLADNQMTVSAVDSAGTLDVDVAKSEFAAAAVGATAADASTAQRINHAYPVTGLFGKSKDDTAVNLHTDNVSIEAAVKGNSANKEVWAPNYEFAGHITGNVNNPIAIAGSNGGYQRFSFDLALTEAVAEAWFQVRNAEASSYKMLFKTTRSGFSFIEGETTAYSAPLQSDKWYHIEIVLRNGTADSVTDHEGWLYIDGRKMAQTSFTWANSSGAAQQIKKLNIYRIGFTGSGSANAQVFAERNIYFDNVLFEYWQPAPSEAPLRTADAELSTTLEELEEREQNGVYAGIDPSITVAQYKAALKDQTLKVSVRDKNGNEVADTDSLAGDGNFIELTAADGVKYYKNAYTTRTIYENTFDTETLAVGGAPAGGLWGINQFNDANYPAFTTAIESGIGGKRAEDKVYAENITNYAGSAEGSSKFFQLAPTFPAVVRTGDKIAAELSVLYKDTGINRNIRFEVLNSAGTKDYICFRTFAGQSTARLYYDPAGTQGDTNAKTTDITLNQWHKYALVFEQGSTHVDAYIDGIKVDIGDTELLSDGFAGISNIRYIHGVNAATEESPMSSNSYFDDFRVYSMPGSYAPDTAVLTSDAYAINQADGTIMIDQPIARKEFDSHIQNDGYYVVYDSADKTSVQMSQLIVQEGSAVFAKNAEGLTKEYLVIGMPSYADNTFDGEDNVLGTASAPLGDGWSAMKLNDEAYPGHTASIAPGGMGKAADDNSYRIITENFAGNKTNGDTGDNLYDPFYHYNKTANGFENGVFIYSTDVMLSDLEGARNWSFNVSDTISGETSGFSFKVNRNSTKLQLLSSSNEQLASYNLEQNRWYRVAVAIPSGSNTATLYINGEAAAEGVTVTPLTNGIQAITRIKISVDYGSRTEENPANSKTSYDNIRFYQSVSGYSETAPAVSGAVVSGSTLTLPAGETSVQSLLLALTITDAERTVVYTDDTFTSEAADTQVLKGGEYLVAESDDGIIKYYEIVKAVTYGPISIERGTGSASASLTVTNGETKPLSASLILCSFVGGRMDKVNVTDFTVNAGENKDISVDLTGISTDANVSVKAFVWDLLSGMIPQTGVYTK